MKNYTLFFRMDVLSDAPDKETMRNYMNDWYKWLDKMADEGHLAEGGNHFSKEGAVLNHNGAQSGPYVADGTSIAGYLNIIANDMEHAKSIASECPILNGEGTSVEIRAWGNVD